MFQYDLLLIYYLPGFVPISDSFNCHFGIRGSNVWKNTHMQTATRAANTP